MMRNLLKQILLVIVCMVTLGPTAALATTNDQLFAPCDKIVTNPLASKSPICSTPNPSTNPVNEKIKTAADIVAIATGLAAVVFIIFGGFTMVTSAGNAEAVANSRKRIIYAVIGLVVVALAWTAISFVTDRLIK